MKAKFLTTWIYTVFVGTLFWSATLLAQTGGSSAPTSQPPWMAPSAPSPAAPGVGAPAPSGGGGGDSVFVPVQPPSEGLDYFQDEEDEEPAPSTGGGRTGSEGKDSFKLLQKPREPTCRKWGNSFLGKESFGDKTSCEFELERRVDLGKTSIDELTDKIERAKLKKVIHGDLKSRTEASRYEVNFSNLQKALDDASRSGCRCL